MRNWITFISCPVNWSLMVGHEGLQWGHGQLSIRWIGQPFRGAFPFLLLSWRLRSQQCRARGNDVPFTWMSVQWLERQIVQITSEGSGSQDRFIPKPHPRSPLTGSAQALTCVWWSRGTNRQEQSLHLKKKRNMDYVLKDKASPPELNLPD